MGFETDIQVSRPAGSSSEWELVSDLVYVGEVDTFIIPAGFRTDFASVPRLLRFLIPKNGSHDAAAIAHDFFYRRKPSVRKFPGGSSGSLYHYGNISRLDSDRLFRRMMRELGVNVIRRNVMYYSVRVFGILSWA